MQTTLKLSPETAKQLRAYLHLAQNGQLQNATEGQKKAANQAYLILCGDASAE